jgi:hypothetical protein
MTATINPPENGRSSRRRPIRFMSMESLGFSDATTIWSDRPPPPAVPRGRHLARPPEPAALADWKPEDVGHRLTGGNFRWGVTIGLLAVTGALAYFGIWLYQRPAAQAEISLAGLTTHATALQSALRTLEEFNNDLLGLDPATTTAALFDIESRARALFDASGDLARDQTGLRAAATQAAGSAMDGLRLAGDAHSYRLAVFPILVAPELETDPALVELDEAARSFGAWQLKFDEVRTALPDGILPDVTARLDMLSGDLTSILGQYVDALREDDMSAAAAVLATLATRLTEVEETLSASLDEIQRRVEVRIEETRQALDRLPTG